MLILSRCLKHLSEKKFPSGKILMEPFQKSFNAHDALEDVLALRKILFGSQIDLSEKTVVENSGVITASHAAEDVIYLDRRHILMQTLKGNLSSSSAIPQEEDEKISGSGLAFQDLQRVYSRFGKEGLIATLSQPPSSLALQPPRVTTSNNSQVL